MHARYVRPLILLVAGLVLAPLLPPRLAQAQAPAPETPALVTAWAERLSAFAPATVRTAAPLRTAAPFAVTAYDADSYDDDAWVDIDSAERRFDAQGRLVEHTATTIDLFTGMPLRVRFAYAYGGNGLVASIVSSEAPVGSDAFEPVRRTLYAYDGDRRTSVTDETYAEGAFVPDRRTLYAYEGGRVSVATSETYQGDAFVPNTRDTYTYGGEDFPLVTLTEAYNAGSWVNQSRSSLTETGGDVISLEERWDGAAWANDVRTIYEDATFDDFDLAFSDFVLALSLERNTLFGSLALLYANFNPTDLFGLFSVLVDQDWNDGDGAWENDTRTTVTREGGRITTLLEENWDEAAEAWENDFRSLFSYDGDGRVSQWDDESWETNAWTFDTRQSFTYDAAGNTEQFLTEEPDFFTGELGPVFRIRYTWSDLAVAAEDGAPAARFALALDGPNPFAARTALRLMLGAAADVEVRLYDVLGREVAVLADGALAAGTHRVALDAAGLAAGLYVVRARAGDRSAVRTVTLAR